MTGATGFLGAHLCRELEERGRSVAGMRRASSNLDGLDGLDVDWVVGDVLDPASIADALAGRDRVYHLAGASLLDAAPETVREVNAEGTRNVLEACELAGTERVVFASTAGTRRSDGVADEGDLARPVGAYQSSKRRAEELVDAHAADGLDALTVHPTSVFGPGDERFTARLIRLVTDPKLFVYLPGGASIAGVDDVVDGLIAAMDRGVPGEHYLLGGENLTYGEALETIARLAGTRPPPVRLPAAAVHAMGPIAGVLNRHLGTRLFPGNAEMARIVTRPLFYTSAKAERELGYTHAPFAAHVDEALNWYATGGNRRWALHAP